MLCDVENIIQPLGADPTEGDSSWTRGLAMSPSPDGGTPQVTSARHSARHVIVCP